MPRIRPFKMTVTVNVKKKKKVQGNGYLVCQVFNYPKTHTCTKKRNNQTYTSNSSRAKSRLNEATGMKMFRSEN